MVPDPLNRAPDAKRCQCQGDKEDDGSDNKYRRLSPSGLKPMSETKKEKSGEGEEDSLEELDALQDLQELRELVQDKEDQSRQKKTWARI